MAELWRSNATRLGERLALEYFDDAPIDPVYIAEQLDIIVEALPPNYQGVSGMLLEAGGNFGIQYATYLDNPGFENFSIAHELGHYSIPGHPEKLLSQGPHFSRAGFTTDNRCELEADHFAAGLLMPSALFDAEINKHQSGISAVRALSRCFNSSLTAAAIRYAQRTSDAVAVVVSEGNELCYCFLSEELKQVKGISWPGKGSLLPRNSVTHRFNSYRNNVLNCQCAENNSSFSDWFGCNKSYELYEEVVGLGRYGKTLTVLSVDELPDEEEELEEEELRASWEPSFK